jgi:hypothetical protein
MEQTMVHIPRPPKYKSARSEKIPWEDYIIPAMAFGVFVLPPTLHLATAYLNHKTAKINYATELLRKTAMVAYPG